MITQRELERAHALAGTPADDADCRRVRVAWRILTAVTSGRRALAVDRWGVLVVALPQAREPAGTATCREPVLWDRRCPRGQLLRNRLRALLCWLAFVLGRLARGRLPRSRCVATPSVGRRGPWSAASPMSFGGAGDRQASRAYPIGLGASCLRGRNMERVWKLARQAPRPDAAVAVRVSPDHGWVASARAVAEGGERA